MSGFVANGFKCADEEKETVMSVESISNELSQDGSLSLPTIYLVFK